jgi:MerR family transcriptional regulator, light-induced transcriptional regulator
MYIKPKARGKTRPARQGEKAMTTIVDLPDDPRFTIKAVASQTGIRPVTLRAWERRHEVLNPHRAGNRYRLYSERDIAILRWLKSRVDEGVSISNAVSELRSLSSTNAWPEALPLAPTQSVNATQTPPSYYAQHLYLALIKHDENRAGDLLREAHAIFDLMTVCMEVLVPALVDVGEAWYRGEIRVTTEHFASAYLRGKLLTLLQAYPSRRSAPLLLIGCAPMEQHELGSLMIAVLARSEGFRVEYLGPDIPIEDLADYASYEQPAMIILSASSEYSAREMRRMQEMLKKNRPMPIFGYGGRAFDLKPSLCEEIPGTYLGSSLEAAIQNIKSLLKQ